MVDLRGWIEEKEYEVRMLIGSDFNARKRGGVGNGKGEEMRRESKDKKINKERRKLIEFIEERGCTILNAGIKEDEKGEWTYMGERGKSVIDYVLVREEKRDEVKCMEVGDNVESDHYPLVVRLNREKESDIRKRER